MVGPFALTKKQCPKDVMQLEIGFLSTLIGNPTWDLVNGDLVIKGPRARPGSAARSDRGIGGGGSAAPAEAAGSRLQGARLSVQTSRRALKRDRPHRPARLLNVEPTGVVFGAGASSRGGWATRGRLHDCEPIAFDRVPSGHVRAASGLGARLGDRAQLPLFSLSVRRRHAAGRARPLCRGEGRESDSAATRRVHERRRLLEQEARRGGRPQKQLADRMAARRRRHALSAGQATESRGGTAASGLGA